MAAVGLGAGLLWGVFRATDFRFATDRVVVAGFLRALPLLRSTALFVLFFGLTVFLVRFAAVAEDFFSFFDFFTGTAGFPATVLLRGTALRLATTFRFAAAFRLATGFRVVTVFFLPRAFFEVTVVFLIPILVRVLGPIFRPVVFRDDGFFLAAAFFLVAALLEVTFLAVRERPVWLAGRFFDFRAFAELLALR